MDDASLQALHGALAAGIGGPDLFAHLLYDRQQVRVGALGALGAGWLHGLHIAHGGRSKVVKQWSERGSSSRHRARWRGDTSGCRDWGAGPRGAGARGAAGGGGDGFVGHPQLLGAAAGCRPLLRGWLPGHSAAL